MNFVLGNCARYEKSETQHHMNRKIPVRTAQFKLFQLHVMSLCSNQTRRSGFKMLNLLPLSIQYFVSHLHVWISFEILFPLKRVTAYIVN